MIYVINLYIKKNDLTTCAVKRYPDSSSKLFKLNNFFTTSALVGVVGCCPHKHVRAAVQAPTNLWGLIGTVTGIPVIGLIGIFFYGSYSGLGSSL